MKRIITKFIYSLAFIAATAASAHAGDGATILFREGQLAFIDNGYSQLVDAYKKLNSNSRAHNIVELKIESSPFLINVAEIVLICRDRCTSLEVKDPRRGADSHK